MAQMYHSPPVVWQGFCSPKLEKEVNQECACLHDQVPNPPGEQADMPVCRCLVVQDSFPHQPEVVDSLLMESGSCLLKSTYLSPHQRISLGAVWEILSISEICLYHISQDSEQNPFVVCTWTEEPSLLPSLTSTPAQAGTSIGLGTCYSSSFFKDF